MYQKRTYRDSLITDDLVSYTVVVYESDLWICVNKIVLDEYKLSKIKNITKQTLKKYRQDIENYIQTNPEFRTTFKPYVVSQNAPQIIKDMASSAKLADVGPMASIAGAIAEYVGKDLLKYSSEVIVENGGDIFLATAKTRKIGIYTKNPKFADNIALEIDPADTPVGICTSSGTLGHSISFGKADAVVAVAKSATVADAFATSIGNMIKVPEDVDKGLNFAQKVKEVLGVVIIKDDKLGMWGKIKLVKP